VCLLTCQYVITIKRKKLQGVCKVRHYNNENELKNTREKKKIVNALLGHCPSEPTPIIDFKENKKEHDKGHYYAVMMTKEA
jgi:hypothetical protein